MSWRYILINDAKRINYKLNNIGIVKNDDETLWICLDEIDEIIIDDLKCNVSSKLLVELSKKGIAIIFCNEEHQPLSLLNSMVVNTRTAKYIKYQICWNKHFIQKVWQIVIKHKIDLQIETLRRNKKLERLEQLQSYKDEVELGDITNREGHAAKVYFKQLFGNDFSRERTIDNPSIVNSSLNYLYQIVRAKICQQITIHGYLPMIGIFHCSEYNCYALADDLIELYRPICDDYICYLIENENPVFMTPNYKQKLISFLYHNVFVTRKETVKESITIVVNSILDALSYKNEELIKLPHFYEYTI